jgi:sarcosine oxidase
VAESLSTETCDVIVIGCGGFGSSAMFHLAQRGLKVIGIDRFHPPHDRGSSHGETRIIRKAYFEHPSYVPLLHRAWELWEELSERVGERLIEQRDLLIAGPPDSEVIEGARLSARLYELPMESLTAAEAAIRYPAFRLPEDYAVAIESTSGYLWAERCVASHLSSAALFGARLRHDETVLSVSSSGAGVRVQTDRGCYSAGAAVVTSGAWTGQLLSDYARHISVLRKTLCWFPVTSENWIRKDRAPLFFVDAPESQFYGIPSVDGATVKVGMHTGGEVIPDPSTLSRQVTDEDERPISQFAGKYLGGIKPQASRSVICMYSMTPDGHFLLDRLPELPIVVAAGFSGHGFKFTSVLGEVAADLVERGQTGLDIGFLSAGRLGAGH